MIGGCQNEPYIWYYKPGLHVDSHYEWWSIVCGWLKDMHMTLSYNNVNWIEQY